MKRAFIEQLHEDVVKLIADLRALPERTPAEQRLLVGLIAAAKQYEKGKARSA